MATTNVTTAGREGPGAADAADAPVIPEMTVPEFVLGRANARGGKRALVEAGTGRELGYAELSAAVQQASRWLASRGVLPGDVLALAAPNSIDFVVAWYAASSAGATVTMVNPISSASEIVRQLRHTGASWLITTAGLFEEKLGLAAQEAAIAETFITGDWSGGDAGESALPPVPPVRSPSDVACLVPSSGTTGLPKNAMLTHRNLVASVFHHGLVDRVTEDDAVLAALPLSHIFGLLATMHLTLAGGATMVILPRFDAESFLAAVEEYSVTSAFVVPPMLLALLNSERLDSVDSSSLRVLASAGAPLPPDLARACARRLGCRVKQEFGMTESGPTHVAPDDGPDLPDSIGPALPGVECRVVDPETNADVDPGEPGELLVRSAGVMRGYLGDPAATAAAIDHAGWLHTGDIVTVNGDGWFSVTGRIKELIKYKGYQVAPAELEQILLMHPAVADAAVVRSPDTAAGEVPKAFVVPKAPASAEELSAWVADRVAPYKRLRRVEFTDQIPKSPSGKILRRQLAERESASHASGFAPIGDLSGAVVLVSGGSRGLGRLLASTLGLAGATVALLARSRDGLEDTVAAVERAGGKAVAVTADVTDEAATAAAVAELRRLCGPINVLINNAGVSGPAGQMWDIDPADWWRTFEVNLRGPSTLARLVLPDMIAGGGGRILNITSNAAVYRWPLMSAYATSKAALVKLTENLAAETRRYGVSVLSVDPGLLPIGLSERALNDELDLGTPEGRVHAWTRDRIAAGKGANPGQAARLILQLAAGRGDRLTGRHLTVSDDLDALLSEIGDIERADLYTVRLRTAPARDVPGW